MASPVLCWMSRSMTGTRDTQEEAGEGRDAFGNDHVSSFGNMAYQIFGGRHLLDALYSSGNRSFHENATGPGIQRRDDIKDGVHDRFRGHQLLEGGEWRQAQARAYSTGSPYDGPDELHTDTWYTVANVSSLPSGGVRAFEIFDPAS